MNNFSLFFVIAHLMTTLLMAGDRHPLWYINEPVVTMRENPLESAEIVSQAIYSEQVVIKEDRNGWSYLMTPDGYFGWVPSHSIVRTPVPYEADWKVCKLSTPLYSDEQANSVITELPFDAELKGMEFSGKCLIKILLADGEKGYVRREDVEEPSFLLNKHELTSFSQQFLGLPYIWGGRSSFGYDCSGFVQMLYKQMGIILPRDSSLQFLDSRFKTISIEDLEAGDLIFWGKSENRIMHVGLSLGGGRFIHTSSREQKPWVRISLLSDFEWSGDPQAYFPYRTARRIENQSL